MASPQSYNTRSKTARNKTAKKELKLELIETPHHHPHHFSTTQLGDLMMQYDTSPTATITTSMMDAPPLPHNIMMMTPSNGSVVQQQQWQWSSPLFSCDKLPNYVATLFCPCTAFSNITEHLILASSEQRNRSHDNHHNSVTLHFTCQETCCTVLSYAFFPCAYLFYTNKLYKMPVEEEEEEEEAFCHRYLPDYVYYTPPPPPPSIEPLKLGSKAPILLVCLASACMIPATCFVRQIVSYKKASKYNYKKESLWTSGIVSCLMWPCALVQVEDELYS